MSEITAPNIKIRYYKTTDGLYFPIFDTDVNLGNNYFIYNKNLNNSISQAAQLFIDSGEITGEKHYFSNGCYFVFTKYTDSPLYYATIKCYDSNNNYLNWGWGSSGYPVRGTADWNITGPSLCDPIMFIYPNITNPVSNGLATGRFYLDGTLHAAIIDVTHSRMTGIAALNTLINGLEPAEIWPGKTSGEGGGTGTFDGTSDDIAIPNVPTLSAVQAGFITLYQPTLTQLNDLAAYMWSSSFDLDTFKKLFADPMDVIVGLSILPVAVSIAGTKNVKIGFVDTGITMNYVSAQFIQIDCGSLNMQEFYGSALDYSPYTKLSIYLPYIGTRPLDTDDIMGKTVHVVYNIDILTGSCTAMVKSGNSVLYEFSGACATAIPISGQNWNQLITSCIQLAGAGLAVAASGGSAAGLLPSTANAVMAMKPNIQHTGAVSGSAGMLGVQIPYIIAQIPRQSLANNYNKYVGYPCNITYLLSTLTGFTQCESVKLTGFSHATEAEKTEIKNLLESGVIIQ